MQGGAVTSTAVLVQCRSREINRFYDGRLCTQSKLVLRSLRRSDAAQICEHVHLAVVVGQLEGSFAFAVKKKRK